MQRRDNRKGIIMKKEECVWYDRKRHFGLPISFTKYYIKDDRFFLERGLLTTHIDEILLYRIRDLSVEINLGQKIFGVGTITVKSTDKTLPELDVKNIKRPREVKEIFHKSVEAMRDKKNMRVSEIVEGNPFDTDGDGVSDFDSF